jgi:hypothetical protein
MHGGETMICENVSQVASIVEVLASVTLGFLTLLVLRQTKTLAHASKQADVLMGCNARYDALWDLRNNPSSVRDPMAFYSRFWSIQQDQFNYWTEGFIPDSIYGYWLTQRNNEWKKNPDFGGVKFRDGWDSRQKEWRGSPLFEDFMKKAMEKSPEAAIASYKAIARSR